MRYIIFFVSVLFSLLSYGQSDVQLQKHTLHFGTGLSAGNNHRYKLTKVELGWNYRINKRISTSLVLSQQQRTEMIEYSKFSKKFYLENAEQPDFNTYIRDFMLYGNYHLTKPQNKYQISIGLGMGRFVADYYDATVINNGVVENIEFGREKFWKATICVNQDWHLWNNFDLGLRLSYSEFFVTVFELVPRITYRIK